MAEEQQQDNETKAGGKRVGILFILAGILGGLLLGGGAVYLLMGQSEHVEAGVEDAAEVQPEKVENPVDLLIVPVRRFAVPLIDREKSVLGYMWIDLAFEVDGPDNQSYVAARLPELRDAFLRDLHDIQTTRDDRPGALDFGLLHQRLETATHETMGEGRVLNVRVTNAQRVPE